VGIDVRKGSTELDCFVDGDESVIEETQIMKRETQAVLGLC